MCTPRHLLTAATVVAAIATTAPSANAAVTLLSTDQNVTDVTAYRGTVMCSEINPVTGNYRLVTSVDGGPKTVIASVRELDRENIEGPFDIDLGTDRDGRLTAIYIREDAMLYSLDVATGAKKRLEKISLGGSTNSSPTIDRGRIAFLHGERRSQSLRYTASTNVKPRSLRTGLFGAVELGRKHLTYTEYPKSSTGRTNIRVRNIKTGRDEVVYSARSGGANHARTTNPSSAEDGKAFVWARTNSGSGAGNRIMRYTLRAGKLSYATGNPRYVTGAWAGPTLGYAFSTALAGGACVDAGTPYCSVGTTGPLTFDRKRAATLLELGRAEFFAGQPTERPKAHLREPIAEDSAKVSATVAVTATL